MGAYGLSVEPASTRAARQLEEDEREAEGVRIAVIGEHELVARDGPRGDRHAQERAVRPRDAVAKRRVDAVELHVEHGLAAGRRRGGRASGGGEREDLCDG